MRHLLRSWEEIEPLLCEQTVVLGLDYDGTLTPIVKHPSLARLSPDVQETLTQLSKREKLNVVLVSGLSLPDLAAKAGRYSGACYVGNHGFEMKGPAFHYVHPDALRAREVLQEIKKKLTRVFKPVRGVFVEDKIWTLSVHYRALARLKAARIRKIFLTTVRHYAAASKVKLTEGKKVWEIRPAADWNKGKALLWLWDQLHGDIAGKTFFIYFGDDVSDEDAFKALKPSGITVKITGRPDPSSAARYYLRSPKEVSKFLKKLAQSKKQEEITSDRAFCGVQ